MSGHQDREHFIPLRKADVVDLLCREETLTDADRTAFRSLSDLLAATFHFEYHTHLEKLKDAYAPFDPDADTKLLAPLSEAEKAERLNTLFDQFVWLLERANFKRLTQTDVEKLAADVSAWGIPMTVDFDLFERMEVFVRGDSIGRRGRRRLRKLWRLEEWPVHLFQRLVVIVKMKPDKRLGAEINTDSVFLKIFKDIPKADVEMLLPGARVRFSKFDQGKIGFPILTGVGLALWNILKPLIGVATATAGGGLVGGTYAIWGMAGATFGYGYRTYYSYNWTKTRYSLQLTKSLYFQNLDNNAGVLYRLLDSAEEQECREALLGYFFLWRHAGEAGWTEQQLDEAVEQYLDTTADVKVNFEIGDAMAKLMRLGLVEELPEHRYRGVPPAAALERLDRAWDGAFTYSKPGPG
jgi:hypothetical protein